MNDTNPRFDPRLFDLLPHRPPMLLINKIIDVKKTQSRAEVLIDEESSFFETNKGVPAAVGLEYMGQTAALIAGYEKLQNPEAEIRLGFLLGSRKYQTQTPYFEKNSVLDVECTEGALVGESLANFNCTIKYQGEDEVLANASLSVLRRTAEEMQP